MNRREFIRAAVASSILLGVAASGIAELALRAVANSATVGAQAANQTSTQQPGTTSATSSSGVSSQVGSQSQAPAGYFLAATLSSLSGKSSEYFAHPRYGSSILLDLGGKWQAFSAICTHRPCTVDYRSSEIYCPCHGATFSASDGSVTRGPATTRLEQYGVQVSGGNIYVSDSIVN